MSSQQNHFDPYSIEEGPGVPVYEAYVIEEVSNNDDSNIDINTRTGKENAHVDKSNVMVEDVDVDEVNSYVESRGSKHVTSTDVGFVNEHGKPASNELWRFRRRGCQDCWAAVMFIAFITIMFALGVVQVYSFAITPEMVEAINQNIYGNDMTYKELTYEQNTLSPMVERTTRNNNNNNNKYRNVNDYNNNGDEDHTKWGLEAIALGVATLWRIPELKIRSFITPVITLLVLFALAVGGALLSLIVLEHIPRQLITLSCWVQAILMGITALYMELAGLYLQSALFVVLSAVSLLWLYLIQDRIPFSSTLLSTAARLIRFYKSLIWLSLAISVFLVGYVLCNVLFILPIILRAAINANSANSQSSPSSSSSSITPDTDSNNGKDVSFLLCALFCTFWMQQVCSNVIHVTIAGVVATWYFAGRAKMPRNVVSASFGRTIGISFGSICFGSLLVAVLRMIRYLVQLGQSARDNGSSLLTEVTICILSCFESLVEYFNEYAFVHVAIYGCSYMDGAYKTWQLIQQCFFAAIFNDALVGPAMGLLSIFLALMTGIVVGAVGNSVVLGIIAFTLSLCVNSIVMQIAQSTVTTIFVCFAEVPEGLQISFPELHYELMRADHGMTYNTLNRVSEHGQYGAV